MLSARRVAAATLTAAALFAPLCLGGTATATPLQGSCSGGAVNFSTNPIGLVQGPIGATFVGNFGGCQGTPAGGGTFVGQFTGSGNCLDVAGQVNAKFNWANGEVSTLVGPWRVPGGLGAPMINTLAIVDGPGAGGQLVVDQAAVDGLSQTGPCAINSVRYLNVGVSNLRFS
ncbi:hypothetical protein [Nocardia arthritidis]|uniref:Uncharacterized protein n=1 Tax=Nocardia arthritidis TaxID=228602 RepID=A0A6G9YLS4_9NOCA|nr:hypothetical protein [Nocardia arthritidis]QIS14027.1 hypothetical protein F5544_30920 [Nocardia arthritidis]